MMKPILFVFVSQLSVTHGWLEFGRRPYEKPVIQRKRVLGLEHVQIGWTEGQKLADSQILKE
jgi:hypothetical protein